MIQLFLAGNDHLPLDQDAPPRMVGEIDDRGKPVEVLQQHAGGHEGDFFFQCAGRQPASGECPRRARNGHLPSQKIFQIIRSENGSFARSLTPCFFENSAGECRRFVRRR